jgi:hypothetical protein
MSDTHEVISSFLDNEPFDLDELADALSEPDGRELLIELVALHRLVQPAEDLPPSVVVGPVRRSRWRVAAMAAALCLAIAGGYVVGERQSATESPQAPPPTRVVQAVPFVPTGGMP